MPEKKKTFAENALAFIKQFVVIASAVAAAIFWFQGYVKDTVHESVKTAFAEVINPMKDQLEGMEPMLTNHEKTLPVLLYRMDQAEKDLIFIKNNGEAILPNGYESPKDPRRFKKIR